MVVLFILVWQFLDPDYILPIVHLFQMSFEYLDMSLECKQLIVGAFMRVVDNKVGRCAEDELLTVLKIIDHCDFVVETFDFLDLQINTVEKFSLVVGLVAILYRLIGTNCTPLISHCSLWKANSCIGCILSILACIEFMRILQFP